MTNKEKLFEILDKMSNQKLSFTINLPCDKCPCYDFCKNFKSMSCNETLEAWLDSDKK